MDQALAILRQPDGLVALVSQQPDALDFATDTLSDAAVERAAADRVAVRPVPLAVASDALVPGHAPLLTAWRALARVARFDGETLFHALVVLAETVPAGAEPTAPLPPLPAPPRDPLRRPTAAHPRAYRGTTYQPPKRRASPVLDLRPYLCTRRGQLLLLARLQPHWPAAMDRLARAGYDTRALAAVPVADRAACEPYAAIQHGARPARDELGLPQPFRAMLLPALRGLDWATVRDYLAVYWALGLDRRPALLLAVAQLARRQPTRNTLDWCRHIARQPDEHRPAFANLLLATGAGEVEAARLTPHELEAFTALTAPAQYAYRLCCLFRALQRGVAIEYLLAGFRLANQYKDSHALHTLTASGAFPAAAVDRLLAHLHGAREWYDDFPLVVWRRCGELDGLGDLIAQTAWTAFSPDIAFRYLHLYLDLVHHDLPPDALAAKWRAIRRQAPAVEQLLRAVAPAYQDKAVAHLNDYSWQWDRPDELARHLPPARALTRRLAQPPFRRQSDISGVLAFLLEYADPPARERLLAAPDRPFRQLEAACRLPNDRQLIAGGVGALCERLAAFAVQGFLDAPKQLLHAAKALGSLNAPLRDEVVRAFGAQPVMAEWPPATCPEALWQFLAQHGGPETRDALPRDVRGLFARQGVPSAQQLQRHRDELVQQVAASRLAVLEQLVLARLAQGVAASAEQAAVRHALQMKHAADENRRAFRKFLKAHLGGQQDYVVQHPRTRAWLRRHPRVDLARWLQGMPFAGATEAGGPVRIGVEQDPLEALKLGTYVGSCVGLGGAFSYSAVAVVLDVNKQVLYARNHRGAVVARQVVALAEDERLVCFSVYPASAEPDLKALFREYDAAFAHALGVPLHRGTPDDDYPVAHILSHAWWDDGAWDFSIESRQPDVRGGAMRTPRSGTPSGAPASLDSVALPGAHE